VQPTFEDGLQNQRVLDAVPVKREIGCGRKSLVCGKAAAARISIVLLRVCSPQRSGVGHPLGDESNRQLPFCDIPNVIAATARSPLQFGGRRLVSGGRQAAG
jgi:hypothetical protein